MHIRSALAAALTLITASFALHAEDPPIARDGRLVSPSGNTLYSFDMDTPVASRCGRVCMMVWPPLTANADSVEHGFFTLVERDDGTRQWAYHGRPLYWYIGDRKRGDTSGDGVGGAWHTVMQ